MEMKCYDIRCGGDYIAVRGPGGGNRPQQFRKAGGWWDASERAWFFDRSNGRAVAIALKNVYGEVPHWMLRDYFNGKQPGSFAGGGSMPDGAIVGAVVAVMVSLMVIMGSVL